MKISNEIATDIARRLGFNLIGFSRVKNLTEETSRLKKWLQTNYNAGMKYMANNLDKKEDVKLILNDARSVISLGMNYYVEEDYENKTGYGKVSRYAWGKDYHLIIWEKLADMIAELEEMDEHFKAVSYVDTGPVMDKAWAVRSGLGWMGKHTNVINPQAGSWFFIANIINNYEFNYSDIIADHCGTCTACIDACPTNAIVKEYVVDSNKCISYQTIENKNGIDTELKDKFENWLFGCDICQDVCPWNKKFSFPTSVNDFTGNNKEISLEEIELMTNSEFRKRFALSPIKRARLKGLKRNADFIK
ncbi:MAG: tRNA epoxyqueuosine(34) reductase QueG [Melioribacteraceae bacterium]|nr:tRNA epoxyqueuosine(34) reductase QueG [Melioribacteraceae bacterium]